MQHHTPQGKGKGNDPTIPMIDQIIHGPYPPLSPSNPYNMTNCLVIFFSLHRHIASWLEKHYSIVSVAHISWGKIG